jgi:3-phytase
MRRRPVSLLTVALAVALTTVPVGPTSAAPPPAVHARAESYPVPSERDSADDIAVWVDPVDPSRSLVIGTDKRAGLEVYELSGRRLQHLPRQGRANNVDLRPGFPLGGQVVDLVATAGRGMAFYRVDPQTRTLVEVGARPFREEHFEQGMCLYHSAVSGRFYAFVASPDGTVKQWELFDQGGLVDARWLRTIDVGTWSEGCVADDDLGRLFVGEEDVGIWRYDAEPGRAAPGQRMLVDRVGGGQLTADVEGLAIVAQPGRRGYLMAASQGDDTFVIYRRGLKHEFVGRFRVEPGGVADGCTGTDGIEALATYLGPEFPAGIFICQDHTNTRQGVARRQNFKFVRLDDVLALAGPLP